MPDKPDQDPRAEWRKEENRKAEAAKLASYQAPSAAYEGYEAPEDPKKSDWDRLVGIARTKFPDHLALKHNITPKQRRVCIAHVLGWSQDRIAELSGSAQSTISNWLNKEECKDFIRAFQYHTASRDNREVMDSEVYASLQTLKDIRDDVTISASTRADVAKWFVEQKFGKSKESKEIKGVSLRDLTEQLRQTAEDETFDLAGPASEPKKPDVN